MTDLSDDELTVLNLCAAGESIAAIGRWEAPCESLVRKKLLIRHDKFNHEIGREGRMLAASAAEERERASAAALGEMVDRMRDVTLIQHSIADFGEQTAQLLAKAAFASAYATKDDPKVSARKLTEVILTRALELIEEYKCRGQNPSLAPMSIPSATTTRPKASS